MSAPSSILVAPPQGAAPNVMELRKDEPRSAVEMWRRRVAKTPTRAAFRLHDGAGWKVMTFGEADAAARELAAGLVAAGLLPGDRICLLSQTRVEWALCDVAILMAGGVTVPIYGSNTAEQCEFIVRDAGAKLVIVEDDGQREKIGSIRARAADAERGLPDCRRSPAAAGADPGRAAGGGAQSAGGRPGAAGQPR